MQLGFCLVILTDIALALTACQHSVIDMGNNLLDYKCNKIKQSKNAY